MVLNIEKNTLISIPISLFIQTIKQIKLYLYIAHSNIDNIIPRNTEKLKNYLVFLFLFSTAPEINNSSSLRGGGGVRYFICMLLQDKKD